MFGVSLTNFELSYLIKLFKII